MAVSQHSEYDSPERDYQRQINVTKLCFGAETSNQTISPHVPNKPHITPVKLTKPSE